MRGADVSAWDDWGIIINGAYTNGTGNTAYAKAAGGFAGEINGAVIGELKTRKTAFTYQISEALQAASMPEASLVWQMYRQLPGLAIRKIQIYWHRYVTLGGTSVVDAFRTFIYDSDVSGTTDAGLEVQARESKKTEYVNDPVIQEQPEALAGLC